MWIGVAIAASFAAFIGAGLGAIFAFELLLRTAEASMLPDEDEAKAREESQHPALAYGREAAAGKD